MTRATGTTATLQAVSAAVLATPVFVAVVSALDPPPTEAALFRGLALTLGVVSYLSVRMFGTRIKGLPRSRILLLSSAALVVSLVSCTGYLLLSAKYLVSDEVEQNGEMVTKHVLLPIVPGVQLKSMLGTAESPHAAIERYGIEAVGDAAKHDQYAVWLTLFVLAVLYSTVAAFMVICFSLLGLWISERERKRTLQPAALLLLVLLLSGCWVGKAFIGDLENCRIGPDGRSLRCEGPSSLPTNIRGANKFLRFEAASDHPSDINAKEQALKWDLSQNTRVTKLGANTFRVSLNIRKHLLPQRRAELCWAATVQAVLSIHGAQYSQCEIAGGHAREEPDNNLAECETLLKTKGKRDPNLVAKCAASSTKAAQTRGRGDVDCKATRLAGTVEDVRAALGGRKETGGVPLFLSAQDVESGYELLAYLVQYGLPTVVGVNRGSGDGHAVLVIGATVSLVGDRVLYHALDIYDPLPDVQTATVSVHELRRNAAFLVTALRAR